MKSEQLRKMVEFYKTLPIEQRAEGLQLLIEWMIQEKEERENCWSQRKTKGSTKKKSETSETTTHTPHTTEVKEKTEFDKALEDFVEMRKKIKKPLTEQWLKLIKDKLEKMYPWKEYLQIKVLNNSISNSRQGVFPLKEEEKTERKWNPYDYRDLSDLPLI